MTRPSPLIHFAIGDGQIRFGQNATTQRVEASIQYRQDKFPVHHFSISLCRRGEAVFLAVTAHGELGRSGQQMNGAPQSPAIPATQASGPVAREVVLDAVGDGIG